MKNMTQWGLAAGLAAALAFAPAARAQSSSSTPGATPESGKSGSPGGEQTSGTGSSSSGASSAGSMGTGSSAAGSNGSTGTDSSSRSTTPSTTSAKKVDKDLAKGMQTLHAANQAEIQMGGMAEAAAQNPQVKEFAKRMVDDHTKNDQQLQQLAETMGVQLTGQEFQKQQEKAHKEMQKVHGKSGAGFDAMYMDHMVKDHEKDVKAVGDLAKKAHAKNQTELATFLDTTHSKMEEHLAEAKQIDKVAKAEHKGASSMGTGSGGAAGPGGGTSTPGAGGTGSGSETTGGAAGAGGGTSTPSPGGSGATSGPSTGGGKVGGGGGGGGPR